MANGNVRDTSRIAPVVTNTGLVQLPTNNFTALVGAVATVGPVSISVAAGSWSSYGGGVYSGSRDYDMDHAVQLVGYGEDSGRLYWLVRNSWGSGWGEPGYIRLERFGEGSEPCGTDSTPQDGMACPGDTTPVQYCGKCAILSASSYHHGCERGTSDANSSLATFAKPFPKPFLSVVLGLSKECRGVNASLYQ